MRSIFGASKHFEPNVQRSSNSKLAAKSSSSSTLMPEPAVKAVPAGDVNAYAGPISSASYNYGCDENVDTKAGRYISYVRERLKLHENTHYDHDHSDRGFYQDAR